MPIWPTDPDAALVAAVASLFELPDAVFVYDDAQRLRALNRGARELLDLPSGATVDAATALLDRAAPLGARLGTAGSAAFRWLAATSQGQTLHLELRAGALSRLPGYRVAVARDCSGWMNGTGELQRRLEFERLLSVASAALIRSGDEPLDAAVVEALGTLGAFFGVDRAYLFLIDEAAGTQSNTHEWVAEGISAEAQNLQDLPLDTFPWLMAQLRDDRVVSVSRVAGLPAEAASERAEFEREGIKSILIVPLWRGSALFGFVGFDAVRKAIDWDEHYVLGLRLLAQMLSSSLEARSLSRRLRELAFHDSLTGLPNRKLFENRLELALSRQYRSPAPLLLAIIDVDDFKQVNDSHGHGVGDTVLQEMAKRLKASVRSIDTVARWGGDEFVLLACDLDCESPGDLAERVLAASAYPIEVDDLSIRVGLSVGIVEQRGPGGDSALLLRRADAAMYQAKSAGKNRWMLAAEAPAVDEVGDP